MKLLSLAALSISASAYAGPRSALSGNDFHFSASNPYGVTPFAWYVVGKNLAWYNAGDPQAGSFFDIASGAVPPPTVPPSPYMPIGSLTVMATGPYKGLHVVCNAALNATTEPMKWSVGGVAGATVYYNGAQYVFDVPQSDVVGPHEAFTIWAERVTAPSWQLGGCDVTVVS